MVQVVPYFVTSCSTMKNLDMHIWFIGECTFEFCNPREHCTSGVEQAGRTQILLDPKSRLDQCNARVYTEIR